MTQKRFKALLDINNQYTIKDNQTQKWYQGLSKIKSFELVEILNELNDENILLKEEVAHYKLLLMSLEEEAKRISQIR
jgi:hypothetical protein